jgi:nucleotide-binding universal stress UspA family protein
MFKTIVLALDGSDGSKAAIPFARDLAHRNNSKLIVAHVEQDVIGKGGGPISATEEEIQAEIRKVAEELSNESIYTLMEMSSVMLGGPAPAIAAIADKVDADLIVCGSYGHSAVGGMLVGSVTRKLLHLAKQPVLVVPEHAASSANGTPAHSRQAIASA